MNFSEMFSLRGKTALITGGAGYFGKQFVYGLVEFGADVIVVEKPRTANPFSQDVEWYEVDLYNRQKTERTYAEILKHHGQIDILINNAFEFSPRTGFRKREKGEEFEPSERVFERMTYDQMLRSFDSGIWWAAQATKKFGLEMKRRGGGSIINIASPYGVIAPSPLTYRGFKHGPNPPGYGVIKAGLLQLTRYSASFLAPVRVNALLPGAIPNLQEKHGRAGKSYKGSFLKKLAERMPLGRVGKVDELVGPLIFLASDASSYVTALSLYVDGGWTQI